MDQTHVHHVAPSLVVAIRRVRILVVVRGLDIKLRVVWVVSVEFDLTLQRRHMLAVDLVGEMPEDTLPNKARLTVFQPQVVFVVSALGNDVEVEVRDVEPEADHPDSGKQRPALEPALGVDVVQGPIRVTLERSGHGEAVRGVLLGKNTEGVDNVRDLGRHASQNILLAVPEARVIDALLKTEEFVSILT